MVRIFNKKNLISSILLFTLVNTTACGYFLYPERRGQTQGRLDPAVMILDAAGLLIGIIPGVAAFILDMATGAIYLPSGEKSALDKHREKMSLLTVSEIKLLAQDNISFNRKEIANRLSVRIGRTIDVEAIKFYKPQNTLKLDDIVSQKVFLGLLDNLVWQDKCGRS